MTRNERVMLECLRAVAAAFGEYENGPLPKSVHQSLGIQIQAALLADCEPSPPTGPIHCMVCATQQPMGVWDSKTGAAVCLSCRDKARDYDRLQGSCDAVLAAVRPLFDKHGPVTGTPRWQEAWNKAADVVASNGACDSLALRELAAQTHGCHGCGEERPARIVAGKLTCPECGSENLVCLDSQ